MTRRAALTCRATVCASSAPIHSSQQSYRQKPRDFRGAFLFAPLRRDDPPDQVHLHQGIVDNPSNATGSIVAIT